MGCTGLSGHAIWLTSVWNEKFNNGLCTLFSWLCGLNNSHSSLCLINFKGLFTPSENEREDKSKKDERKVKTVKDSFRFSFIFLLVWIGLKTSKETNIKAKSSLYFLFVSNFSQFALYQSGCGIVPTSDLYYKFFLPHISHIAKWTDVQRAHFCVNDIVDML